VRADIPAPGFSAASAHLVGILSKYSYMKIFSLVHGFRLHLVEFFFVGQI
jgi:hypothetical protein